MLFQHELIKQINARREEFLSFDKRWREDVSRYALRLINLAGESSYEIRRRASAASAPGAIPSTELDSIGSTTVHFGKRWQSHEEARRWAMDALLNRTTAAADGSHFIPGRDISVPVAAVQVAFFSNPHTREGRYNKETTVALLTPSEIMQSATDIDSLVGFRRFQGEVDALCKFLRQREGWQKNDERMPLAFFDGTLLISYARPRTPIQDEYVESVLELINLSRETGVPVVGYIDHSYARDLVNLIETLGEEKSGYSLYDAQILHAKVASGPLLKSWGDRTGFFYCEREGLHDNFLDEQGDPLVGFSYLQTTADGLPARLDLPSWIFEAGLLDEVVSVIRAECVVGNGYPYPLEAADGAAVIRAEDRSRFLRAMQEFYAKEGLDFRVSRKSISKGHRR